MFQQQSDIHGDAVLHRIVAASRVEPVIARVPGRLKADIAQVRRRVGSVARRCGVRGFMKNAHGGLVMPASLNSETDAMADRKGIEVAENRRAREGQERTVLGSNRARSGACGESDYCSGHRFAPADALTSAAPGVACHRLRRDIRRPHRWAWDGLRSR